MSKTKVLFFLFGGVGGAERMTISFAKMLPLESYDVKFVICGKQTSICDFIPAQYEVFYIKWQNIHVFPRLRLALILFKEQPDYVFSSTMQLNVILLQVASWFGIDCIVRNDNMLSYASKRLKKRLKKYYPYAKYIVAQTEEMQNDIISLIGSDDHKIKCIHNPLDIDNIKAQIINNRSPYHITDSVNYVWCANFMYSKGHDILIDAFKIVHKKNPKAHLYFVGKTNENDVNYKRVKVYAESSGVGDYIHFVGFQKNPYVWMKYASCFVLPSRIEGLPNVLLEAMCLKVPVVASLCIPIINRIVKNGYNGYIVPVEDSISLAQAMIKAPKLDNFDMIYRPCSNLDIIKLFH